MAISILQLRIVNFKPRIDPGKLYIDINLNTLKDPNSQLLLYRWNKPNAPLDEIMPFIKEQVSMLLNFLSNHFDMTTTGYSLILDLNPLHISLCRLYIFQDFLEFMTSLHPNFLKKCFLCTDNVSSARTKYIFFVEGLIYLCYIIL